MSFAFYVAGIPEGSDWFWRRAHPSQAVTHLSRTPRDNEWRNQNNNNNSNNTKEAQEKEKSAGGAHNGLFLARLLLAFPDPGGVLERFLIRAENLERSMQPRRSRSQEESKETRRERARGRETGKARERDDWQDHCANTGTNTREDRSRYPKTPVQGDGNST